MRRGPLIVAAVLAIGVLGIVLANALRPPRVRSVIVVTVDTLRADRLGAYGRTPSITPELDALAERGVVFDACWTTAPLTVPAHASLLTGLIPPVHGLRTNDPAGRLPTESASLAEAFHQAGFATAAFVSSSVLRRARTGLDAGFDVYSEVEAAEAGALHDTERPGMDTVEAALAWLGGQSKPVFVWVHLFDPHAPYDAPPPWGPGESHTTDSLGYDGEVAYADHCVGELLRGLGAAGLDDPVVAVTSDHGEGLGEHGEKTHGFLLHEATLHVPLIVSAPGAVAPGRRTAPVSLVDVPSTLLGLAGLTVPDTMAGRPLLGRRGDPERTLYAETLYGWRAYRWSQAFALRRGTRKWVSAGAWKRAYDLAGDPNEMSGAPIDTPADPHTANALETLSAFARAAPLAPSAGPMSPEPAIGYAGGGSTEPTATLSAEENAALPSPYDRIGDEALLARGRALLAARTLAAFEQALEAFGEVLAVHEGNPAAHEWRGKALAMLRRYAESVRAHRRAFELGYRGPGSVALTLRAYAGLGLEDVGQNEMGLRFLSEARGAGLRDDAGTWAWEAWLLHKSGRDEEARAALERAIAVQRTNAEKALTSRVRTELDGSPK